jgi:hypothetical protein
LHFIHAIFLLRPPRCVLLCVVYLVEGMSLAFHSRSFLVATSTLCSIVRSLPCRACVPCTLLLLHIILHTSAWYHSLICLLFSSLGLCKISDKTAPVLNYSSIMPLRRMRRRGLAPLFLTSALDGCERSASRPSSFNPGETELGTLWIVG